MKYLITGITGTLGQMVCNKLLCDEKNHVTGLSRDEFKQAKIPAHPRLTLYLGDVRDEARIVEASRGMDLIFHFAALKHVNQLEANPEEAVATNIIGTMNVLHAQRVNHVPRVVLSSTDKAAYPINAYGNSKGLAETLTLRNPQNVVCRYGNVLASRGSFIETMVKAFKKERPIPLTDENMTRFWITAGEAADFVIQSSKNKAGGLHIPVMKAAPLHMVVASVAEIMQVKAYKTEHIGMRAGEKVHECLKTQYEGEEVFSHTAMAYSNEELRALLGPVVRELQ